MISIARRGAFISFSHKNKLAIANFEIIYVIISLKLDKANQKYHLFLSDFAVLNSLTHNYYRLAVRFYLILLGTLDSWAYILLKKVNDLCFRVSIGLFYLYLINKH